MGTGCITLFFSFFTRFWILFINYWSAVTIWLIMCLIVVVVGGDGTGSICDASVIFVVDRMIHLSKSQLLS